MQVERSFAFLDLCGFTAYTATQGDDRATSVLSGFRATLRDIASRRGVRVAKWLGDGAMIVGVETEPLVSAMMEVVRRIDEGDSPLDIRAGMALGPVILFEGDWALRSAEKFHPELVFAETAVGVVVRGD